MCCFVLGLFVFVVVIVVVISSRLCFRTYHDNLKTQQTNQHGRCHKHYKEHSAEAFIHCCNIPVEELRVPIMRV